MLLPSERQGFNGPSRQARGEGGLEEPLVYKVNLRLSVIREETRVGPGAVGQPTWG